jgi:G3E family GTPase
MQMLAILGPLGSGKTTILRELMSNHRPFGKVLLVINDVGQVNIDAVRLEGLGDIEPMTAGCIGCSDLGAFLEVTERAKAAGIDHVIVEPTGIADGREIRDAALQADITMSAFTLVDVQHFDRNRALGVMETQLSVASHIGLTWSDDFLQHPFGVAQPELEPVVTFCGQHAAGKTITIVNSAEPGEFVSSVMERYSAGKLQGNSLQKFHCITCGHDHHHVHSHGHKHYDHHNHGVYAESGNLPGNFTRQALVGLMADLGETLVRAKGVVEAHAFDFTQGSLRWGMMSPVEPYATFISTAPLGIIKQHVEVQGNKKALMRGYQVPLEATIAALEWQLAEYPSNRAPSGEIRVDCEADIVRQLCEREGVPIPLRAKAIQKYVGWRLESLRILNDELSVWAEHSDFAYWQRRLGAVLCWHAENVSNVLADTQIVEMVKMQAPRHALEGLLGLAELSFDEERAEERPELIADCLGFAEKQAVLDRNLARKALQHCLKLSQDNHEWNERWVKTSSSLQVDC